MSPEQPDGAEQIHPYARVIALADAARYEEAVAALEEYVRPEPQFAAAYRQLAFLYYARVNRPDLGIEALKTVLELEPGYAPDLLTLGRLYDNAERYAEAEETYLKAYHLAPTKREVGAVALIQIGWLYARLGRDKEAFNVFHRATLNAPDDPSPRYGLGYLHARAGDMGAALAAYRTTARIRNYYEIAYEAITSALQEMGDKAQAETILKELEQTKALSQEVTKRWANLAKMVTSEGPESAE